MGRGKLKVAAAGATRALRGKRPAGSWQRCPACLMVLPIYEGHRYDIKCWMEREGLAGGDGELYAATGRGEPEALAEVEQSRWLDEPATARVRELFLQFERGEIDREQLRLRRWHAYSAIGATDPGGKWPTAAKMATRDDSMLVGRPL